MNEQTACIALNMLPKLGPVRVTKLWRMFGSAEAILQGKKTDFLQIPGIGSEVADTLSRWPELIDLDGELARIEAAGVTVLTRNSPDYPKLLKEIHDPPTVLYVWGKILHSDQLGIGIVGTRKPSHYAAESAKKLSYQLAYHGLTIYSGLARGIDTAAHQAALAAHGRTVAVIGSGLGKIYPRENIPLAEKIAASGAVVSEFSMLVQADRQTFPMRNRIISGCSTGLLVVEAGTNSGALISANQAIDQGRPVYAVPGRIDHPGAIGSNRLIQQGAKLILDAQDIIEDLNLLLPEKPQLSTPKIKLELHGNEKDIYEALGDDEAYLDNLVAKTGLPTATVSSTLLALEMRRLVKQLPGSRFVKVL